jgi:hypothetical protein
LIFAGTTDPTFETTRDFVAKWKDAGHKIEISTGEGGHGFSLMPAWLDRTFARMEVFLISVGCLDPGAAAPSGPGIRELRSQADPRVRAERTPHSDPNAPVWMINGKDKLPKVQRLLGTTENVRVVVRDLNGKQVLEIRDVFHHRNDLNKMLPRGEYRLEFFDKNDKPIPIIADVSDILRLR